MTWIKPGLSILAPGDPFPVEPGTVSFRPLSAVGAFPPGWQRQAVGPSLGSPKLSSGQRVGNTASLCLEQLFKKKKKTGPSIFLSLTLGVNFPDLVGAMLLAIKGLLV